MLCDVSNAVSPIFRIVLTCASSLWYCSMSAASTWTSAGASAGAATNSRDGLLQRRRKIYERYEARSRMRCVPNKLPREPEEWLLEVVVRLRGDLEVLDVFLAVEGHAARLHFPLLQHKETDKTTAISTRIRAAWLQMKCAPSRRLCCRKGRWGCSHRRVRDRGASWGRSCT